MNNERLNSWKEIGGYLQRNEATVRRWEKREGLPVHRHTHESRNSVYAYPREIDAWRLTRRVEPQAEAYATWRWPAVAATALLCLIMVGNGVRPQTASAQQPLAQNVRQVLTGAAAGGADNGSLSADGRYLTFTNWATGDLGVRDLTTGASRLLTNSGGWETSGDYTEQSTISPDGREIAYHWFIEKGLHDEVRIVPLEGAAPRTVYRSSDEYALPYGWTPDGKQLLALQTLADHTSRIVLLSVRDGSIRPLKSLPWSPDVSPAISPDGRYVAYDSRTGSDTNARDIFVLATDGSRETVAVQSPADDYSPLWSPDGAELLFLSDRTGAPSLWQIPLKDGKPAGAAELVKDNMGGRFVKPLRMVNSGALYYVRPGGSRSNVYTADLDADLKAAKPPTIGTDKFVNANLGPAWSPDGQQLAYYSSRGSALSLALMVRTLRTGEEREVNVRLPLYPHFGAGPKWFPDGRSVLVAAREPQRAVISFYRVELTTGKAELLWRPDKGLQGYALSPDGKAIFGSEGTDTAPAITTRLVRFDLESHAETELRKGEWFIELAVSPDSKQLAYLVSVRPGAASYLAVIPAIGGQPREVFRGTPWIDGSRYSALSWTPDSRNLVFARGSAGAGAPWTLWRVPITGGDPQPLGISFRGQIRSPEFHPDGRKIVFGGSDNADSELWALENFFPKATTK